MKIFSFLFLVVFLFAGIAYAQGETYGEAERLLDAGEYKKAEDLLKRLISAEPNKASYHQLLGDVYKREGRLKDALSEYAVSKRLGGENPELMKSIGTVHKWMRNYAEAEKAYKRAIQLNPRDEGAKADLKALELRRRLNLKVMTGGWEPDYTTKGYEAMLSYSGVDRLDLYAGYGYADQIYYTRQKVYAKGYYFYNPSSYVKLQLSYKDYNYPVDPAVQKPNPDSNSYDIVPVAEFEISHWISRSLRGSLAYEYFRPSFFYDKDSTANNHKVSAELYYITPFEPLRLKLMYAVLRDPDPKKTEIKGRDNLNTALGTAAATDVVYQTQSLLGGGVEFSNSGLIAELKYLPNRDLDSSYEYSLLAGVGYEFTERITGRLDYVYDKYSSVSIYAGKTANVYLASVFYGLSPSVDIGVGYKYLNLPNRDANAAFLTISYKTGLGS